MKIILKSVLVLWVIVLIVGFMLPKEYEVSRSIIINADVASVHAYSEDLELWQQWQPWQDADPTVKIELGPITRGVGASQAWRGEGGDGELLFTQVQPNKGIDYDVWFNGKQDQAKGFLTYRAISNEETEVTWTMTGAVQTPIFGGYLALMMDNMVGPSFQLGLFKLRSLIETGQV
ncbi:SRPBCC family protein [Echinimonas agarilytica]|uniref:SRPBCC family protein n=1 Tax=Echinimonas agarilytica TaxID=1215918 RepID=A0AA42B7K4_9GAMM|nr:SRPBCC family protein [Echinimonas agarilytica]